MIYNTIYVLAILGVLSYGLNGCDSPTETITEVDTVKITESNGGDTLWLVSTKEARIYHSKGGDTVGNYVTMAKADSIEKYNGFWLQYLTPTEEVFDVMLSFTDGASARQLYAYNPPKDSAYWWNDTDFCWELIALKTIEEKMNKSIWE